MNPMQTTMVWLALGALALALSLLYFASPRQRLIVQPLPRGPAYVSALMAALVAARGLLEGLDPAASFVR
jgi:hypothetical protein